MQKSKYFRFLISFVAGIRFRLIILLISGAFAAGHLSGQQTGDFKPGGRPEARIFTSFSSTFEDGENHNKFDIARAYLGYSYNFSQKFSGRIVYDVADPSAGNLKFTGMLKFAYLRYQTDRWTITGGMIPLPEYDQGDRKWGFRYVYKTLHDEYGFGTSADLGLSIGYKISPLLSADLTIMNGEGFKLTETDSILKGAAGITLTPAEKFSLRAYYDVMAGNKGNQHTAEFIAAYESKELSLSGAYNFRKNNNLREGHNYHGLSVNGAVSLSDRIRLFGRFDHVASVTALGGLDSWNLKKAGQLVIAGMEIGLAPGVSIAPNFQGWSAAGSGMPFVSRFSLSLDLKL
ncbi:MAG TPA: hypothetical protein PLZ75_07605 [Bacteroidales bacterium]|jgi:hypothetical protein|nr:hypothetical protein [Bacteroidales bacterium]HQH22994.1 hypothetical protein [Bacteroidales bacterium]HQJ82157.1 hypothetical protein [Bacteroidales bacterium]